MLSLSQASAVAACCYGSLLLIAAIMLAALLAAVAARVIRDAAFEQAELVSDLIDQIAWLRNGVSRPVLVRAATRPASARSGVAVLLTLAGLAITATACGAAGAAEYLTAPDRTTEPQTHTGYRGSRESPREPQVPAVPSWPKHYAITGSQRRSRRGALARDPRRSREPQSGGCGATEHPKGTYCERWWRDHGPLQSQANEFARLWGLHLAAPAAPAVPPTQLRWTLSAIYELLRDAVAPAGRAACLGAAVAHLNTLAWASGPSSQTAARLTALATLIRDRLHEPRLGGDCDAALIAVAKLRSAWS